LFDDNEHAIDYKRYFDKRSKVIWN
jgi:hypothetical protein